MESEEIRKKFLEFYEKRGHTVVPSSSLVPVGDVSVLFTTAGMQQFKPYYIGKADAMKDFGALNTVSIQKCIRTSDIEEVGDESHLTFFEMLGNFSFGGYFKEKAIHDAYDFVTKEMGLKIDYVTVFEGEDGVPADEESEKIWKSIDSGIIVKRFGRADNFWGPTGTEGPCGPTAEIYVDGIEIWNLVFNQYYQSPDKTLKPLDIQGIDTGMGLERLALVSQFPNQAGPKTIFETDLFAKLMEKVPIDMGERKRRIIVDHARASAFMISDGVLPSNKERGYVLRRLIRQIMAHTYLYLKRPGLKDPSYDYNNIISIVVENFSGTYPELDIKIIRDVFDEEYIKFSKTLDRGVIALKKIFNRAIGGVDPETLPPGMISNNKMQIRGEEVFGLYQTYGLPPEVSQEIMRSWGIEFTNQTMTEAEEAFSKEMEKHRDVSRAGVEQKFKGGLAGHSDMEIKYHTATHLLNAALREVLGDHVKQRGSNITTERLRFDFSHTAKLTDEEKKKVEDLVNKKIKADLLVVRREMPREEAVKEGAQMEFGAKYPDIVSIYCVEERDGTAFSKEFCGGPHVEHTGVLGTFKITKEESVAAGVRRIKAVLE